MVPLKELVPVHERIWNQVLRSNHGRQTDSLSFTLADLRSDIPAYVSSNNDGVGVLFQYEYR